MPEYLPQEQRQRLKLLSCLREKKTSSVYLAEEIETGEKRILKITVPGATNQLSREYELLCKLAHPGVPRAVYVTRDDAGREFLLRTYAEGDTLQSLLERDGVFSHRQTLEIALKICEILDYLHRQSPPVIYRDITPGNVVLTPNGRLSLIDFGISREDTADKDFDTVYVGSAAFAAPEQFGFTKTDRRSDIFTIGKLMIYLATGDTGMRPYTEQIGPGGLKKIIEKCTRLSPEKRYDSVSRLSRAIRRQLSPPSQREYLAGAAGMLLIFCLGTALGLHVLRPAEPKTAPPPPALNAAGDQYADEVKIPVLIETTYGGAPVSDCAVAVDNHHWYQPAQDGRAELLVYAYDNYSVKAAAGNRTAIENVAVTRDSGALSFALDLALVPSAPEYQALELAHGARYESALGVEGADSVTLSGEPAGVSVALLDAGYSLIVDGVEQPGHYTIFAEFKNEYGTADMVISLRVTAQRNLTYIRTAQELDRMREDLSGHYILAGNIDLSGVESWTPVGAGEHPFTGVLDGNGFEISGLTIYGYSGDTGLFGSCERAVVKNLVLRDVNIQSARIDGWGIGAVAGKMEKGLIENCTVGGSVTADTYYYSAVGGICGRSSGTIIGCYNAAEIQVSDIGRSESESMAGGVCGENTGYMSGCGNEGAVSNSSIYGGITGGVAGFCDRGMITRCYSTGTVRAPSYSGHYPPGGITHLLGRGKRIYNCAFKLGSAPVGATVWNGGVLLSILPLSADELHSWMETHIWEHTN